MYLAANESDDLVKEEILSPIEEPVVQKRRVTRFTFDIDRTLSLLRSRIFGQDEVIQSLDNMLKTIYIDIIDPEKPLYIALFLGPTGVGKTEVAKVLSEAINGDKESICRIDMNTLSQEHYAASLSGSPPGYAGSKEGYTLLEKEIIEGSYNKPGIIVFDEIEKASTQVIQTLLNIFDNGLLRLASGEKTINFRNTVIIMTSNLGANEIFNFAEKRPYFMINFLKYYLNPKHWMKPNKEILNKIVMQKLTKSFNPEFINRIDEVLVFNWLERSSHLKIVDKFVDQLNKRLKKHNCRLILDQDVKKYLVSKGFDRRYGARTLKRTIKQYLEVPLAELLIKSDVSPEFTTYVAHKKDASISIKKGQPLKYKRKC